MPIYEYKCRGCNHEFEELQKMEAPASQVCPQCSRPLATRLLSTTSFHLKGGGWAKDSYKGKSK